MSTTTSATVSTPGFIVDPKSMRNNDGRQIDWATVNVSYQDAYGKKVIPAGTAVSEESGLLVPSAESAQPAIGLLVAEAREDDKEAALSGHGVYIGGVVYENLLPDADTTGDLPAAIITELNTTSGCTFQFEKYSDSRLT